MITDAIILGYLALGLFVGTVFYVLIRSITKKSRSKQ